MKILIQRIKVLETLERSKEAKKSSLKNCAKIETG